MKRHRCRYCGKDLDETQVRYCNYQHCVISFENERCISYPDIDFEDDYVIIKNWSGHSFKVDWQDYINIRKYSWNRNNSGYFVAKKSIGLLHRYITQCPDEFVVDHINGDRSDNRRCNLRVVTHKENMQNKIGNYIKETEYGFRVIFEKKGFYKYAMCDDFNEAVWVKNEFLNQYREKLSKEQSFEVRQINY